VILTISRDHFFIFNICPIGHMLNIKNCFDVNFKDFCRNTNFHHMFERTYDEKKIFTLIIKNHHSHFHFDVQSLDPELVEGEKSSRFDRAKKIPHIRSGWDSVSGGFLVIKYFITFPSTSLPASLRRITLVSLPKS